MLNQKGFSHFLILPVLALVALAFFAGTQLHKNSTPTDISKITADPFTNNTDKINGNGSIQIKENSITSPAPNYSTSGGWGGYGSTSNANSITIAGMFRIPDFYKINYSVTFPKNGGAITGSSTGVCTGNLIGNADAPDNEKEARFTGNYDGKCQPIPGLGFKTDAKADLEGQINYKEGKVHVIYHQTAPYDSRGGFELSFNP